MLIPILFGQIATGSGFTAAWVCVGAISFIFALVGFAVRSEPLAVGGHARASVLVDQPANVTTV